MIPLRPSSGIGPHETFMEERVLETTLTSLGGLVGTGSKEKTASSLVSGMNQPQQKVAARAKCGKTSAIEITIDCLVKVLTSWI